MLRWLLLLVLTTMAGFRAAAQEALPSRAVGEKPSGEPRLFLNDLGDALPAGEAPELGGVESEADVEQAKAAYERAQSKQQRWQRLAKAGVLAQVEAEAASLQASRARAKYERARAAWQQRAVEALRARVASGEITADALATAESALLTAQTMAAEADAALRRTQLLHAEINVDRQRRLAAAGAGSKRVLQRAQATLQQLKGETP